MKLKTFDLKAAYFQIEKPQERKFKETSQQKRSGSTK